jgi:hypothetical protein
MTEEDYEVDEGGHKKIHKVGRADWFYFFWSGLVVLDTLLCMSSVCVTVFYKWDGIHCKNFCKHSGICSAFLSMKMIEFVVKVKGK